ncbi:MAG TPA: histidine kinase [Blastocatellia bacterium]
MPATKDTQFPSFWRLQIAGWVGFYLLVLAVALPYTNQKSQIGEDTWFVGTLFVASLALRAVCRSLMRRSPSWLTLEAWAIGCSLALGGVASLFPEILTKGPITWEDWSINTLQCLVVLVLWCNLYFSIKQWRQSAEERERLLRAEAEAREARLSALRYQLNPHFLFNSLNAVTALVLDGNAPAATRMLAQIGEFLRTTLASDSSTEVPLSQELAFANQYLAIEQTRLGERLRVDVQAPPETLGALVPDMFLQPLLENAIQHGVAPRVEGGTVSIESLIHGSRLRIVVRNSGDRAAAAKTAGRNGNGNGNGIGLANTAQRLKVLYGSDQKCSIDWPRGDICEVTVELPLKNDGGDDARLNRG